MKKTILSFIMIFIMLISLTSCKSESEINIQELIQKLNSNHNYNFDIKNFNIEQHENIIYHTMIDNKTLLSFYSNKENEIIQCTLSSFDIKNEENFKLITDIGTNLTNFEIKSFEKMLINAKNNGQNSENGWCITIIENELAITYIINHTSNTINNNQLPTLKKQIE